MAGAFEPFAAGGSKVRSDGRPSLADWLMTAPDVHVTSSSSSSESEEEEDRRAEVRSSPIASPHRGEDGKGKAKRGQRKAKRALGESDGDEDEVEDVKPVWTGDEKWPRLDNPTFSSKEEPLVLRKDPYTEVPSHIAKYLRAYQLEGVQFLFRNYNQNKGCILGDDMGLGKTVQTTAFLMAVLGKKGTSADICTQSELIARQERANPVLIACPASLIQQWKSELLVWCFFHIGVCHGAQREEVANKAANGELEILIASYETYRSLSGILNTIDWEVVVFDEAHRIKNSKAALTETAMQLKPKRRIGLTGTLLQNEMKELHCTMSWANPGCLGLYKLFKTGYETPIKAGQKQKASPKEIVIAQDLSMKLKAHIDEHVLRRGKDMIADQVPGKEDWIVVCPMSRAQEQVYRRVISHHDYELMTKSGDMCECGSEAERRECCYQRITPSEDITMFLPPPADKLDDEGTCRWNHFLLPAVVKLTKICNHLDLIRVNPKDAKHKQQADRVFAEQAFDTRNREVLEMSCGLVEMSSDAQCGKLQMLKKLLVKMYRENAKVLIFSLSVRFLNILENFLVGTGHKFLRLDGSTPPAKRLKIVSEYNSNNGIFIMLMSTKAGGLGINLTSANTVIIVDPNWNPSHDLQAQDRAFRIGQRRHVKVFRLLAAGTIEETIYQRQIYKQQLVNITMDASNQRRYYTGVQGDKGQKGELWGVANLFKWRDANEDSIDTKSMLKRERGEAKKLEQEVAQQVSSSAYSRDQFQGLQLIKDERELDGPRQKKGGGGAAGGAESEDEDDDDVGWQDAAKVAVEEYEDELEMGRKKKSETALSIMDILMDMAAHTHKHEDVVSESSRESALKKNMKGLLRYKSGGAAPSLGGGGGCGGASRAGRDGQNEGEPAGKKRRTEEGQDAEVSDAERRRLEDKCQRGFQCSLEDFLKMLSTQDEKTQALFIEELEKVE